MTQSKTTTHTNNIQPAVLITGASSGIGKATALALSQAGYYVIGTVRNQTDGDYLVHAGGTPVLMDVSDQASISQVVKQLPQLLSTRPLQGIVNNAGISLCVPWQEVTLEDFRLQLEINLVGVIAVTKAFLPFIQKKYGKIIMMSSTAARFATAMMGPYSCSKYALEAMTETLRQELWHDGIQVISIQPGPINTPIFNKTRTWITKKYSHSFNQGVFGKFPDYAAAMGAKGLPPERVARAVVRTMQSRYPRLRQLVSRHPLWFILQPLIPTRWFDRMIATALYGKKRNPS